MKKTTLNNVKKGGENERRYKTDEKPIWTTPGWNKTKSTIHTRYRSTQNEIRCSGICTRYIQHPGEGSPASLLASFTRNVEHAQPTRRLKLTRGAYFIPGSVVSLRYVFINPLEDEEKQKKKRKKKRCGVITQRNNTAPTTHSKKKTVHSSDQKTIWSRSSRAR